MTKSRVRFPRPPSLELAALLRWTAGIGAVTAEALACVQEISVPSARGRLSAATQDELLARHRLLSDLPALYTVTRAGLRRAAITGLEPCRISAANSSHAIACAHAAAELQRSYPDHRIVGEGELRRDERRLGSPVASAVMRGGAGGRPALHRPDLAIWSSAPDREGPVVVEIELTIKAPRRLEAICRAWARARGVSGVLYLAAPEVRRPLERAIDKAQAAERIAVLGLEVLPLLAAVAAPSAQGIPSKP
jgi:hypothetical protein